MHFVNLTQPKHIWKGGDLDCGIVHQTALKVSLWGSFLIKDGRGREHSGHCGQRPFWPDSSGLYKKAG